MASDLSRVLAFNLKRYRTASEMSQVTLASETSSTQPFISDLEAGKRNPSMGMLARLADSLGVEVVDLFAEPEGFRCATCGQTLPFDADDDSTETVA